MSNTNNQESLNASKEATETVKDAQTIPSGAFSSEPYANSLPQQEEESKKIERQAKENADRIKEEEAIKAIKAKIKTCSLLDKFILAAEDPLSFANTLSDDDDNDDMKKLLAMVNMDAMARKSGYEGFSQLNATIWSSKVIGLLASSDSEFKLFTKDMTRYENAALAVKSLEGNARDIDILNQKLTGNAQRIEVLNEQLKAGAKNFKLTAGDKKIIQDELVNLEVSNDKAISDVNYSPLSRPIFT